MISALADAALPLLRLLSPETAHTMTLRALSAGFSPRRPAVDPPSLAIDLWGRRFPNPIGLAAGFDKDAAVPDAMLRWGFGFVEAGTVTPRPQAGNPRPRLFRLERERSVINRMGFNNLGADAAGRRLEARARHGIVGANIGKNKTSEDAVADYCACIARLGRHVDYLVVNVSSPNTPGLRDLQRKAEATILLDAVVSARNALPGSRPPILLKISPDLSEAETEDIVEVALAAAIDGMTVANTTIARPEKLDRKWASEAGGLSGPPLMVPSTRLLARVFALAGGRIPLVGVGGVSSGVDAYAKILAGASLVQLYTALVYRGPGLIETIKSELAACLARDGFKTVSEAVGRSGGSDQVAPEADRLPEPYG